MFLDDVRDASARLQTPTGAVEIATAFLRDTHSSDGLICIASREGDRSLAHRFFPDRRAAAEYAVALDAKRAHVWAAAADYCDPGGGRRAENVLCGRTHWLDCDVGRDGFASKADALQQLARLCGTLGLPAPILVDSGGGIHVWFVFDEAVTPDRWRPVAQRLKDVCRAQNFAADPSRTADIASLMRLPGTPWSFGLLVRPAHPPATARVCDGYACACSAHRTRRA